jgi:hypothetical protein
MCNTRSTCGRIAANDSVRITYWGSAAGARASGATDTPVCCNASLGSDSVLAEFLAPTSAGLACAKLFFELAACVGGKKLARVKPVFSTGEVEDSWDSSREVGVFRAAEMPERCGCHGRIEAGYFLRAAIAVRRDGFARVGSIASPSNVPHTGVQPRAVYCNA